MKAYPPKGMVVIRVHLCPSVVQGCVDLFLKNETHQIIGCAMEVMNILGHGLLEKPYENALVVEFGLQNVPVMQQPRFDVDYKSVNQPNGQPTLPLPNGVGPT